MISILACTNVNIDFVDAVFIMYKYDEQTEGEASSARQQQRSSAKRKLKIKSSFARSQPTVPNL